MASDRRPDKVKSGRLAAPTLKGARMARVATGPTRVVPPVHALLADVHTVAKTELARMLAKQAGRPADDTTPGLAKQLDQLTSALERAFELDQRIQEQLGRELSDATEDELAARERALNSDGGDDGTEI